MSMLPTWIRHLPEWPERKHFAFRRIPLDTRVLAEYNNLRSKHAPQVSRASSHLCASDSPEPSQNGLETRRIP
jgi:hypothetical protein